MPEFEIFKSEEDEKHYWRLKAANGQIIAVGGEGYETHSGAVRAMGAVKRAVLEAVGQRIEQVHEADAVSAEQAGG